MWSIVLFHIASCFFNAWIETRLFHLQYWSSALHFLSLSCHSPWLLLVSNAMLKYKYRSSNLSHDYLYQHHLYWLPTNKVELATRFDWYCTHAGSLNINTCSTKDIPLYLIIAGSCLSVEVLIHTFTILASMNTDNESVLRSLRMCDCFAFFILIWILIGSNWIFKVSVNSKSCIGRQDTENELLFNQLDNSTDLLPDVTTPRTCEDCSNSVYQFAVGLIVLQYIVVFLVFVACCCVAIRKGAH